MSTKMPETGMRKGTKSCLECRKKKIRCVFTDDTKVCMNCRTKRKHCVEQSKVPKSGPDAATTSDKTTLEERVAQLEALISSQASGSTKPPANQYDRSYQGSLGSQDDSSIPGDDARQELSWPTPSSTNAHHKTPVSSNGVLRDTDPVGSIFDNAIWKRSRTAPDHIEGGLSFVGDFNAVSFTKSARVCDELCKDLPPPRLLASILNTTSAWWNTWRAVGNWLRLEMVQNNINSLQDVVHWALGSSEPPVAALGILCVATSMQQLNNNSHEELILQLTRPPGDLFHDYLSRVIRLVVNDNGYATSYAGIEVLDMTSHIFMNLGLLKTTWILNHRAITHAQLLGLHRRNRSSHDESDSEMMLRHETWFTLCGHDLYTSLLLGLPYAADGRLISPAARSTTGSLKFFQYKLIRLSSRIIDRDQMGEALSVSETHIIERDLDLAANEPSAGFWDAPTALRQGRITRAEYYERLAAQFWFFQMKVLLHQPLMIESIENHQLLYNRNSCLSACRKTLKIYQLMRSDGFSAFSMVKVIDFQAFLCSALLLLGLLGYGSLETQFNDQHNDWETTQSIIHVLRQASAVWNNSFASQAAHGLETLASLIRGRTETSTCPASQDGSGRCFVKISIPGSGTISIAPGKLLQKPVAKTAPHESSFPPPIFHLSHGEFRSPANQQLPGDSNIQSNSQVFSDKYDTPQMDFDWTNLIDMDLEGDWAWLADVNDGIL